jgi:hypothetical protein
MSDQGFVFSGNLPPKLLNILPGEFEPGFGMLDGKSPSIVNLNFIFDLADQQATDLVPASVANRGSERTQHLLIGTEQHVLALNTPIRSALWRRGLKLKNAPGHDRFQRGAREPLETVLGRPARELSR